jgi:hypothetical protein
MTMQKKKDIKPLIKQLQTHDYPSQLELETLKLWFLDFLSSVEGITDLNCFFNQSSYPKYVFNFRYASVPFRAVSVPPSRITISTLGISYHLDSNADCSKNLLVLASALASELKILRVDFN